MGNSFFQIIDDGGVISGNFETFTEALDHLTGDLDNDETFEQNGELKIAEVHFIRK